MTLRSDTLLVVVAIYFAALCNLPFWRTLLDGRAASLHTIGLTLNTFAVLTCLHVLLLVVFSSRFILKPVLALLFVGNAIALYFLDRFGIRLDPSMIRNVAQTDPGEVRDLITGSMIGYVFFFGILPTALLGLVRLRDDRFFAAARRKVMTVVVALMTLASGVLAFNHDYTSFFRNHRDARHLLAPASYLVSIGRVALETSRADRGVIIPVGADAAPGDHLRGGNRPVLLFLVVGETARAENFSLGGYARDTNPELRRRNAIYFPDVWSCGTSTADSLPCMFSNLTREGFDAEKGRSHESLLDVVERAKFKVVWRDNNSGCKHICDRVGFETFDSARVGDLCDTGECYDEVLLDRMSEVIAGGGNVLVVMHQKGSHGPAYFRRYPPSHRRFEPACESQEFGNCSDEEIRNAYDNSILYSDFVLGRMIDYLESVSSQYDTALLYVSDHGESLGEKGLYLHGLPWAIAPDVQKHVPMVFWMSREFETRFDVDRERLIAGSSRPLSHDNLFHSVLGVLDIRTSAYERSMDLFASAHALSHGARRGPTLAESK